METADSTHTDWLQPPPDQQGLKRYVETIRERIWLVVAAVLVTTAGAAAYVATAEEVYEANTEVLLTPVSDEAGALSRLGLLTESTDPVRAMETATTLIASNAVAEETSERLGLDVDPRRLLGDISVDPIAESNILTVTARGSDPAAAADLANAFARSAIALRTQTLHERIDEELPLLQARRDRVTRGPTHQGLTAQIVELETIRASSDPTLAIVELATEPTSPVSPRRLASLVGGLLAGLVLGAGGAFALQVLDPRLRRETQLRDRFRLPILARVPRERGQRGPLRWEMLTGASIEAYRTLRAVLARPLSGERAGAVLITSPGPSEGKSTTALNLAASLSFAGNRVILIEADLRRPSIGVAMGIDVERGLVSVLIEEQSLQDALIPDPGGNENLQLLLAEQTGTWGAELLSLRTGQRLVEEAKLLADYVVIDSPPLATVVDALPLTRAVEDILLVVRLGTSRLNRIQELAELLADTGIKPAGFAVIGVPHPRARDAYYGDYRRGLTAGEAKPPLATRSR